MLDISKDREDFARFLRENNISQKQMDFAKQFIKESIPSPGIRIEDSRIEGLGAYAVQSFLPKDVICMARVGGDWTVAGRYANHSITPNAEARSSHGAVKLVAIKEISVGDEVTVNYRSVKLAIQSGGQIP